MVREKGLARVGKAVRFGQMAALACLASSLSMGGAAASERAHFRSLRTTSTSISMGLPWEGRLARGVPLHNSATIRRLPRVASRDNFYGTGELIGLLERSARTVAKHWQGSRLTVGELSARKGGWLDGHHSHRNGRDVDVAFYMRDRRGKMAQFWRFVPFSHSKGARRGPRHLQFDDERNWKLVTAMLADPEARVQYMFVCTSIRKRLLKQGRRSGASTELLRAAAAVLREPKVGNPHVDHFHVRIFCSRDDRPKCQDEVPFWPWYDGVPPDGDFTEPPTIRWRTARASR